MVDANGLQVGYECKYSIYKDLRVEVVLDESSK